MRKSGFTLVEMLAVLLIIALLAAAVTFGLSTARYKAWRTQARSTCSNLCDAWKAYLLEAHKFPSDISGNGKGLEAKYDNLKWIVNPDWMNKEQRKRHRGRIYFEMSDEEKENGLLDHWGQPIRFSLDLDYDNELENPYPNAFDPPVEKVTACVIAWSEGDPKHKNRDDNPIVVLGGTVQ